MGESTGRTDAVKQFCRAIPTVYRGIRYRSRFEADCACLLDFVQLDADYEPHGFLLDDGTHYLPDFRVAALHLWVETRGYDSAGGERQIDGFAAMVRDGREPFDYVVIGSDRMGFYSRGHDAAAPVLGRCQACLRWRFAGDASPTPCRACAGRGLIAPELVEVVDGKILVGSALVHLLVRPPEPHREAPTKWWDEALRSANTPDEEDAILRQVRDETRARRAARAAR